MSVYPGRSGLSVKPGRPVGNVEPANQSSADFLVAPMTQIALLMLRALDSPERLDISSSPGSQR